MLALAVTNFTTIQMERWHFILKAFTGRSYKHTGFKSQSCPRLKTKQAASITTIPNSSQGATRVYWQSHQLPNYERKQEQRNAGPGTLHCLCFKTDTEHWKQPGCIHLCVRKKMKNFDFPWESAGQSTIVVSLKFEVGCKALCKEKYRLTWRKRRKIKGAAVSGH